MIDEPAKPDFRTAVDHIMKNMCTDPVLEPSEPYYTFSHTDGKIQIFSVVKNVQMFPGGGLGRNAQNFVAECGDEEAAHALLDRIGVSRKYRPERK